MKLRLRTRAYRRSQRIVRHLPGAVRSAHSLLWLRLLDHRDIDQLTMHSYASRSGSGFDSEAHNVAGLHASEETAFRDMLTAGMRVLVAGAGGGREMIALAKAGHDVTGFDAAADLVEACRANLAIAGARGTMMTAQPGAVPDCGGGFDALVIGRGVYHHIPGRTNRIAFLRACAAMIEEDGPMIMGDVLTRSTLGRWAMTSAEPGDSLSDCFYHYFTVELLAAEIAEAGFDAIECRATPSHGASQLTHVIARRRAE